MFWWLRQVQVPGDTVRIWSESQVPTPPPQVLWATSDGGAGGGLLHRTLPRGERHHTGVSTVSHHIKCGGVHVSPPLGFLGGGTGGGGKQRWQRRHVAAGREYKLGKGRWPTAGIGGACKDYGEGGVFFKWMRDWWLPPTHGGSSLHLIRW